MDGDRVAVTNPKVLEIDPKTGKPGAQSVGKSMNGSLPDFPFEGFGRMILTPRDECISGRLPIAPPLDLAGPTLDSLPRHLKTTCRVQEKPVDWVRADVRVVSNVKRGLNGPRYRVRAK